MRNFYFFKLLLVISGILISGVILGQKSQLTPSFKSPFQAKGTLSKQKIVKPSAVKTVEKKTDSWTLQKQGKSFLLTYSKEVSMTKSSVSEELRKVFSLPVENEFDFFKSQTDELGYIHSCYQQTFKGIKIYASRILLHEKQGKPTKISGKLTDITDIDVIPSLTSEQALSVCINKLGDNFMLSNSSEPIDLFIVSANDDDKYFLCYKMTMSSTSPYSILDVFVDAKTGEIIKQISRINYDSGSATTMYSGTQTIETENMGGYYRLHDNTRNIETYNMLNSTDYADAVDFTDTDNNWNEQNYTLDQISVSSISTSWWYMTLSDELPDIYIKIYDGSNSLVFETSYINNQFPPLTFNIGINLTNPPYYFELWDYDAVGSNDFGGSYSISLVNGTQSYSGSGNSGTYNITAQGNSALDAHWATMKIYDYFLTKFSRNSFDGAGSTIKSYIHYGTEYENAFWNGQFMTFGDGASTFSPLTCLDVTGHEFGHAVVEYNGFGGLDYEAESGALNESFADIFGTCVEFYAKPSTANWTVGEDITMQSPYFLRSLSTPNNGLSPLPDTYQGQYWEDISNLQNDHGGVHTNSGAMNFWFYLLSQGGSGTNDFGNSYSVTGIGITKAEKIAYRNLTNYLSQSATYYDAMIGSLQAAEDLYGAGSIEYWAVKDAWYAVGLGNTSNNVYCSGVTTLTDSYGTIEDGSGSANYLDNSDCMWLIQPAGANSITLNFTEFSTEDGYDSLLVYDGPDTNYAVLMTWWGPTMPPQITSSDGAMLIRFMSDGSVNETGWSANYTTTGTATCDGGSLLTTQTGSFNEGSGSGNYGNNQTCYWLIAPPCATSISLSFSAFNTEQDYDGIIVYDGNNTNATQLGVYTGTSNPGTITSSGGEMLVVFVSDFSTTAPGFTANYTSSGTPYCSGTTTTNLDYASFDDGSGSSNYCNNANCSWLIQPTDATSITLFFDEFDLESPAEDGTIYDAVKVYDGVNSSAPLLGVFSGNSIPSAVSSTGGSLFVQFTTDFSETNSGFSAYYLTNTINYCSGNTVLTSVSGSLTDGSNASQYGNNSECSWLIQPTNAQSITLSFSQFTTEQDYDGVLVFDGSDTTANILGTYTGTSLPSPVTSSGGSMFVLFLSDQSVRDNGWNASYSSVITGIETAEIKNLFRIYPNPNKGTFFIECSESNCIAEIFDLTSKKSYYKLNLAVGKNDVMISNLSTGVYILKLQSLKGSTYQKLIIE
ncbi:MAG: hypothetical protein A2W98_01880 [Bacteroidetes bacterium GWF2_33_38]|nr:MAG: hypothetical protein A2W98_01880 [Bacteroidetes bacterium GWF2_33_38]OFY75829.1 MAG: hypothetical protein A2265_07950 [Bacteroidetes bacterium RIFOXYA12_FULL_33_9]HBX52873.1 hypothetical protein [Bacteroidales bacterium]